MKKTDFLKIFIGATLSTAAVILLWMLSHNRFVGIPLIIVLAVIAAVFIECGVLMLLRGKNVFIKAIKIITVLIINVAVFSSAVIYSFAPAIILQPHSDEAAYNKLQQLKAAEELTFEGTNGRINGWFYNAAGQSAPTVLYFYGNYETASTRLLKLISDYDNSAFKNCNFAVFDYPAYGNSEGRCSDDSLRSFALDVFDELSKRTDNIIVLGYSVGTGPACYLAGNRDCTALILYAPYADGTDLYNNVIDIFHGPLEKLVAFNMPNIEYVKSVSENTLILASEKDELIPLASSLELIDKFKGSCLYVRTPDISHNEFLVNDFVKEETEKFINEVI